VRVAIAHDRLTDFGGASRVVLVLAKIFRADIYTGKYSPTETFPELSSFNIVGINPLPELPSPRWHLLANMLDATKFSTLDEVRDYDLLFLSGEWAHFASKQNLHNIWYCHTPNRALYDLRPTIRRRLGPIWGPIFEGWAKFWTPIDQRSVGKVRNILANSKSVKERIKRFYRRESSVVYPPVNVKKFTSKGSEDYWLSVQRIKPEKRLEIQLKVFEKLSGEKLIVVGGGKEEDEYTKKMVNWIRRLSNVEWLKNVTDEELRELYAHCKGVIQTPVDEDFGLVAVEAMASGKPCVAVDEGGFREIIIPNKTGLLIKKPYVANLARAIKNFEKYEFNPKVCVKIAENFSEKEFTKKIKMVVKEVRSQTQ